MLYKQVLSKQKQITKERETKERKKDVNTYVKDRQKKIEKKRKRKGEANSTKTNKQIKNSPKRRKCDKMAHRFFC